MAQQAHDRNTDDISKRPPQQVMRLARMGSFHQSRLSFMRVLLRHLKNHNWQFDRPIWEIDDKGVGVATYCAIGPDRTYTLIAFSHDLPDELRSDRVIAEAWDATFTLFDGTPTRADIERLRQNVPLQEAGRISESELSLSRANRSVRLFKHVVDRLSQGQQPDIDLIEQVGYLMRTTAVYGSGKFGAADREIWADRPEFAGSFQPELLSVWLTRAFTLDIVEHLARVRAPETAVTIDPDIRRRFGVGNSTGLGMAPFLINHPTLIHAWINARETALARVRAIRNPEPSSVAKFAELAKRAQRNVELWQSEHPLQVKKIDDLKNDMKKLLAYLGSAGLDEANYWENLFHWTEDNLSLEGQEQVVSLMLEPYGEIVDDLAATMSADETSSFSIDGSQTIGEVKKLLSDIFDWALKCDFNSPEAVARVWYVSEEKLEPRLGERFEEPLEPYEQPLAPGRDAAALMGVLANWADARPVAEFLLKHPEYRHTIRRAQIVSKHQYAEIRDNTISASMLPIDLLRCKLSFFGATHFDPRSDRWVRITMYQGAPFPNELAELDPDELAYPPLEVL